MVDKILGRSGWNFEGPECRACVEVQRQSDCPRAKAGRQTMSKSLDVSHYGWMQWTMNAANQLNGMSKGNGQQRTGSGEGFISSGHSKARRAG